MPAPSPATYSPATLVRPNDVGLRPPSTPGTVEHALGAQQPGDLGRGREAMADAQRIAVDRDRRRSLDPRRAPSSTGFDSPPLPATGRRSPARPWHESEKARANATDAAPSPRPARRVGGAAQARAWRRASCAEPLTSTTAATSAPALTTPAATAASSGPAPATTTRLPGEMRWDFSIVVAAARPNTPGVVHPGNGSTRSIGAGRNQQRRRLHRVRATVTDRVQPKAAFAAHDRPDAPAECRPDPGAAQLAPQGIAGAPVRVRVSGAVPGRPEGVRHLAVDLAAGGGRFVDEQHRTPGRVRGDRGAGTGRPCPEHGHIHRAGRRRGTRSCRSSRVDGLDAHAVLDRREARLAQRPVNPDQTLLTDTHHAEGAPRTPGSRAAAHIEPSGAQAGPPRRFRRRGNGPRFRSTATRHRASPSLREHLSRRSSLVPAGEVPRVVDEQEADAFVQPEVRTACAVSSGSHELDAAAQARLPHRHRTLWHVWRYGARHRVHRNAP